MGQVNFTTAEIEKLLDGRYNNFRQDVGDSTHTVGSPQAVLADTEYLVTIDALSRNDVTAPTYITDRWDSTNNKIALPTELDHPVYVGDIGFVFDPTASSAGVGVLRIYIDDAVPKEIRAYTFDFKGDPESVNIITTWYLGEDAGFDAKNDGVYFTVEFDQAGSLYNKGAVIYRT